MLKSLLAICILAVASGCTIVPQPLTNDELREASSSRLANVAKDQEPIAGPISLHEAMARAIKYNLDYKVELFEEALRISDSQISNYVMLPDLVVSSGLNNRNNYNGTRSSQIQNSTTVGGLSETASTSSPRNVVDSSLVLSWDILDFGLSYVRAKQSADRILIANERKRKVINRVIANVRTAYWRAVSAERLANHLRIFEKNISKALEASENSFMQRKIAPLAALTYQRELLQIKKQIQTMESEMSIAKTQLAALMNVRPGEQFKLEIVKRSVDFRRFRFDIDRLVDSALINRPELRELSYEQRINKQEAHSALLEVLPGLSLFGGYNNSSSQYLYNDNWGSWGARASFNLLQAFKYPASKRNIAINGKFLDQRGLALTMSIITQVYVSVARYGENERKLNTMKRFHSVNSNIRKHIHASYKAGKASYQTFVREHMNSIVAEAQYDIAFAEMQNSYADIATAIGYEVYGKEEISRMTVEQLASHLSSHWRKLEKNL